MTIVQLKYAITIANVSSMRQAADKLFISQPALSSSIRELEEELGIHIFERTSRGIIVTEEGKEFLEYAKQAVSQYAILEDRYISEDKNKNHFSVSMQHYVFAVRAFVNTIKKYDSSKYVYTVRETKTYEVLSDVSDLKSEVGIVAYTKDNEKLMKKLFQKNRLCFEQLMVRDTYAYVSRNHPLAHRKEISIEELRDYPCVSFDQSSENDFYLYEEALSNYEFDKLIKSNDRATSTEILAHLNGSSIGTGIMTEGITLQSEFVAIKLKEDDPLTIGYIVKKNHKLSEIGEAYIEELNQYKE